MSLAYTMAVAALATLLLACQSAPQAEPDGWQRIELRDYLGALSAFDQALERSDEALSHAGKGHALYRLGRYEEAVAEFGEAIRLEPKVANWYVARSVASLAQGDSFGATRDCDAALAIEPDLAKARFNRGLALRAASKNEQALADFTLAIELQPKFAAAFNSRGILLAQSGRLAEAVEDFRTAASLDPGLADAHANLGAAYYTGGDLEQAFVSLNTAIRLDQGKALFFLNRGQIYSDLGDKALAELDFERAFALAPDDARVVSVLGRTERHALPHGMHQGPTESGSLLLSPD